MCVYIYIIQNNIQHNVNSHQQRRYKDVTKRNTNRFEDTVTTLTKFLYEFKGLFNQLLRQNSIILNMLTLLISKIN